MYGIIYYCGFTPSARNRQKPMDIFGKAWENYVERLADKWQSVVKENDVVVLPGDFSWATYLEQSVKDFEYLHKLNGKRFCVKAITIIGGRQ